MWNPNPLRDRILSPTDRVDFRERHSAELGRLRKQIGELATSIPMPLDLMLDSAVLYSLKCQGLISGG